MRWLQDNWIGTVLGPGSRTVLASAAAVAGVIMVVSAPPNNNAPAFYVIGLFCLMICVACIGHTKARHFLGSVIGSGLLLGSLWYVVEVSTRGPRAGILGPPSFMNMLVVFLALGIPGFLYAATARFGLWRSADELASRATRMTGRAGKPIYYRVDPWNLVIGVVALTIGLVQMARSTTPWILSVPLLMFIYTSVKRETMRSMALRNKGYYPGRRLYDHWLYEEVQKLSVAALVLPVENTEPGHWEMFIPDDAKWRAIVPDWARDRREEIGLRIAEAWKPKDFHLPDDLKAPKAGG
jgi:hypothetical protein